MMPAAAFDERLLPVGDCRERVRLSLLQHGYAVLRGFVVAERLARLGAVADAARGRSAPGAGRRIAAEVLDAAIARVAPAMALLDPWPVPDGYTLLQHILGPGYRLAGAGLIAAADAAAGAVQPADGGAAAASGDGGLHAWLPLAPPSAGDGTTMVPGDVLLLRRPASPLSAWAVAERIPGASLALSFAAAAPGRPRAATAAPFAVHLPQLQDLVALARQLQAPDGAAGTAAETEAAAGRLVTQMGHMLRQALPEQVLPALRAALEAAGAIAPDEPAWVLPERDAADRPGPGRALPPPRQPRFGLCMAVRNHARALDRSLGGIAGQWRPFDQVVLVNDASDDDTPDRLEAFARGRANVTVLHNDRQQGPVASIRRAEARLDTDYVAWAAADDWLLPGMLLRLSDLAARWPQAGLMIGETGVVLERGGRLGDVAPLIHGTNDLSGLPALLSPGDLPRIFACRRLWFGTAWLLRRDALRVIGGFQPAEGSLADFSALAQVLMRWGAAVVPERLGVMTSTDETYSRAVGRDIAAIGAQRDAVFRRLKAPAMRDVYARLAATPAFIHDLQSDADLFATYLARRPAHWDLMARAIWWALRHGAARVTPAGNGAAAGHG